MTEAYEFTGADCDVALLLAQFHGRLVIVTVTTPMHPASERNSRISGGTFEFIIVRTGVVQGSTGSIRFEGMGGIDWYQSDVVKIETVPRTVYRPVPTRLTDIA